MTGFTTILAFPAGDPTANCSMICSAVEALDGANCIVTKIRFGLHQFNLGTPHIMAMLVTIAASCPLDNADEDERETWLLHQFDLQPNMQDCAIVEI